MSRATILRNLRLPIAFSMLLTAMAACSEPTAPPQVSSIILTAVRDTLTVGASGQIAANVLGTSGNTLSGVKVEWSSSTPAVATVSSSGVVTAVAPGRATISATAGGKTSSRAIVVRPPVCGAPAGAALTLGGSRTGNTATSPCLLFESFTAVGFPFTMSTAGGVRLSAQATGFAASIVITDNNNSPLAGSFGSGPAPSVRTTLPAGSYRAWVMSDSVASASHTFTLTATAVGGACETGPAVSRTIGIGAPVSATVTANSCILLDGPVAEGWRLVLTEPSRIRAVATSAAFAPLVAITAADYSDLISFNRAEVPGLAATLAVLPAGEYLVWGGTFDNATGAVQVSVEVAAPCAASGTLALGASVNGALQATDCPALLVSGAYADIWTFTIADTTNVQFDLTTSEFDAFLELRGADDVLIVFNDDFGGGLNSRIVRRLPPGTYRVWASSFSPATTGAYSLSAAVSVGAVLRDGAPREPSGLSSPSGKPGRPGERRPWPRPRTS